ncbi:MAG: DUF1156 domain-containing protein [Opitutales bacterium]|nr:DUF1156 domain-containing protein [Opitutales bacterium]
MPITPLKPFSWRDQPALIERLFPVQKISAESFKEQMAGSGKTLTALGSYWKGRKPLFLNKACILGCLMPTSDNPLRDLEIFEMLMGMDDRSLAVRHGRIKPDAIARRIKGLTTADWFQPNVEVALPEMTPFEVADIPYADPKTGKPKRVRLQWKDTVHESERLDLEARALPFPDFKSNISAAKRCEELGDAPHAHIWREVNEHLGTNAQSFPELVEQMGIARFGRRPKVADIFCGSGQIPFEAARLGCDVYASDLNPIACMLTWGAFNIVGAAPEKRAKLEQEQAQLAAKVQAEIDALGVEEDGQGWRAKAFLYCVEVVCPETGWKVPLIPSFIISAPRTGTKNNVVAQLKAIEQEKRYEVEIVQWVPDEELSQYKEGSVQGGSLVHSPDGVNTYRVSLNAIRGDYKEGKENRNRLRLWEKEDFVPRPDDIFQERLYAIQWMRPKPKGKQWEYEFRAVTESDLQREQTVIDYVGQHLAEWQEKGFVPDMMIEKGDETERLYRERGWTHWHHLFNSRQLLVAGIANMNLTSELTIPFSQSINWNSKLSHWSPLDGGGGSVKQVFYNQALNTFWNHGSRASAYLKTLYCPNYHSTPFVDGLEFIVETSKADQIRTINDLYITDPPYGDAVKYEEITEFFIAWLRKNPPKEFAHWTWDSRRSLAIKGEDDDFRRSMIRAYRRTAELMPDNGMQVIMFTHQSGSIWADMANIIWASGLQVTAAWYVVTETDSALRQGANVTGTILLVLRKRKADLSSYRDDLAWEIEAAVKEQIESLVGLDKSVRQQNCEGLYTDSDLQMAGYAAALKVLTAYSTIDGKDMVVESEAPRVKGRKSFVEDLIEFAVQTAVQFLVPVGFEKSEWQRLQPVERYYLKMLEMEHQGNKTLDNYQNFAKAFKIRHFDQLMSENSKANAARVKTSVEFRGNLMGGEAELSGTPLRALLYALFELSKETEVEDILLHLMENCPNYNQHKPILAKMADYIAEKREGLASTKTFKPEKEAANARVLAEAIPNQRL